MDDQTIVALYWARDEEAIAETARKYGSYCGSIARNILHSAADTEECLNDTWLHTWNSLPPQRPAILSAYLAALTRNLSLSRYRAKTADKRGGHSLDASYEELQDCIPDGSDPAEAVAVRELGKALDRFLRQQSETDCCLFLRRYWYYDSISQIADRCRMAEGTVKTRLHRIRKRLKVYLEQEGYTP